MTATITAPHARSTLRSPHVVEYLEKHLTRIDKQERAAAAKDFLNRQMEPAGESLDAQAKAVAALITVADTLAEEHRPRRTATAVELYRRYRGFYGALQVILPAVGLERVQLNCLHREIGSTPDDVRNLDDEDLFKQVSAEAKAVVRGEALGEVARAERARIVKDMDAAGYTRPQIEERTGLAATGLRRILGPSKREPAATAPAPVGVRGQVTVSVDADKAERSETVRRMLGQGFTTQEIAATARVSTRTVRRVRDAVVRGERKG